MLSLKIDSRWDPEDFIEVLGAFESLYYKGATGWRYGGFLFLPPGARGLPLSSFSEFIEYSDTWLLSESRALANPEERLRVERIAYGSPGSIDFLGLGKVFEVMKDIIIWGVEYYSEREHRAESLRTQKLENARRILELKRDFPDDWQEVLLAQAIADQDTIYRRIADRQIIGADTTDGGSY